MVSRRWSWGGDEEVKEMGVVLVSGGKVRRRRLRRAG